MLPVDGGRQEVQGRGRQQSQVVCAPFSLFVEFDSQRLFHAGSVWNSRSRFEALRHQRLTGGDRNKMRSALVRRRKESRCIRSPKLLDPPAAKSKATSLFTLSAICRFRACNRSIDRAAGDPSWDSGLHGAGGCGLPVQAEAKREQEQLGAGIL